MNPSRCSRSRVTEKANVLPPKLSRGMSRRLPSRAGCCNDPAAAPRRRALTGLDPLGIRRMRETIVARGRAGGAVIARRTCCTWFRRSARVS